MDAAQYVRELRYAIGKTLGREFQGQDAPLTQEELAHLLLVMVSSVSRWENGHAVPTKHVWAIIHDLVERLQAAAHRSGKSFEPPEWVTGMTVPTFRAMDRLVAEFEKLPPEPLE